MTNEELEQKVKRLEEQLTEVRIELLERKAEPIPLPYQVKIPANLGDYYTIDIDGSVEKLSVYTNEIRVIFFLRGLTFKTKGEAEQHLKEIMLLFKLHKWAEEQNGNWYPYWEQSDDKFYIYYFHNTESFCVCSDWNCNTFNKLPYFKSEEIAKQFIEEFGDEIKEVLL